jgi:NitT/TauT family transport system permease protein
MTDLIADTSASDEELNLRAVRSAASARWRRNALVIVGWVVFFLFWEAMSRLIGGVRLPSPATVGAEMWRIVRTGLFIGDFTSSILKIFYGFGFSVVAGSIIGFAMGRSPYWKAFFQDLVMASGTIPGLAYAIVALVIFGISLWGPVLSVALMSMPYIALNVAEGLEDVDRHLLQMSDAYRRKPRQVLRHVLIPAIVPYVFAGIRLSFALAWKVEQLTEIFGSSRGVGFRIRESFQRFSVTGVLTWVLLFIVFMIILERLVLMRIERRLFRWRTAGTEAR